MNLSAYTTRSLFTKDGSGPSKSQGRLKQFLDAYPTFRNEYKIEEKKAKRIKEKG